MRRSVSRASKISIDGHEPLETSLPGIPDGKWHEFLEAEDTDLFILSVREEIVENCLKICYEKYMQKQVVAFTVHCAYLAWAKVLNVYYMFKDPGDMEDPKVRATWEPDDEPPPSVIDSWGSECIQSEPLSPERPKSDEQEKKVPSIPSLRETDSLQTCSFLSNFFNLEEGEGGGMDLYSLTPSHSLFSARKKSIFTRTLSMSKESLPLVEPLVLFKGNCNEDGARKNPKNKSPVLFRSCLD